MEYHPDTMKCIVKHSVGDSLFKEDNSSSYLDEWFSNSDMFPTPKWNEELEDNVWNKVFTHIRDNVTTNMDYILPTNHLCDPILMFQLSNSYKNLVDLF